MNRRRQWFVFGDVAVQPTRYGTILIDAADLAAVLELPWHVRAGKHLFVRAWTGGPRGRRPCVYLHDFLMPCGEGFEIDFKNGNGLDCRRCNLRIADRTQNCCNRRVTRSSSGFLGVDFDKSRGKWRAQIKAYGKYRFVGRFSDVNEAVAAREEAAAEMHGEFASTLNAELMQTKDHP